MVSLSRSSVSVFFGRYEGESAAGRPLTKPPEPTPLPNVPNQPGAADRAKETRPKQKTKPKTPESEIDILYENQRGGFLCGIPLFSSMALGNLDPPAWTNFAHKASPTDIHTAQVPDPSWEWAWPEWKINLEDGVDEDGWEYSFMFSRHFSWHKAKWWNSFVRRRAWIRKRVKKDAGYVSQDPNMLNPEYFSVRPSSEMGRSPSRRGSISHRSNRTNRTSMSTANDADELPQPDIESVEGLLRTLGESRIDREKIDAVDNYLEHAEDDLSGLQNVMHEIMSVFVFQASRRVLLSRLTRVYDEEAAEERKGRGGKDTEDGGKAPSKRVENLAAAVKHADEEVRRLEYWSDVKGITAGGDSKGAVDESKGWDPSWEGLDRSGPPAPPKPE